MKSGYQFKVRSGKTPKKLKKPTKKGPPANIAHLYMELRHLRERLSQEEMLQSAR